LALAVNVYRYPVAYLITSQDNKASDFAGLKGESMSCRRPRQGYTFAYSLDRQAEAVNKEARRLLLEVTTPQNLEDALDDVV